VLWHVIAHGLTASRPVTSDLHRDAERDYIGTALEVLGAFAPTGWLGPQNSATLHTLDLLAEAGLQYACDWANDDEPYATTVTDGGGQPLWIHPNHTDLSDLSAMFERKVLPWDYADRLYQAAAPLARESARRPRLLTLQLHPWLSGQAHVTPLVRDALQRIVTDFSPVCLTPRQAVSTWQRAGGHPAEPARQD
jgi:peptidoglycan/xylan/chitin deacetylase (PgdA/CDA1 family)